MVELKDSNFKHLVQNLPIKSLVSPSSSLLFPSLLFPVDVIYERVS